MGGGQNHRSSHPDDARPKADLQQHEPDQEHCRGHQPTFVLFCGLLFQPLTRDLMNAYQISRRDLKQAFADFVAEESFRERPEIIVLTAILPDPINAYVRGYTMIQINLNLVT